MHPQTRKSRGKKKKISAYTRFAKSLLTQIKGSSPTYGGAAMPFRGWSVAMFTSGTPRRGELSNAISITGWFG